jgi:hypothetical protein
MISMASLETCYMNESLVCGMTLNVQKAVAYFQFRRSQMIFRESRVVKKVPNTEQSKIHGRALMIHGTKRLRAAQLTRDRGTDRRHDHAQVRLKRQTLLEILYEPCF